MTAFNAALLMAVAPCAVAGRGRACGARGAAWLAALLYVLDLPLWHHLGRAHAPASFGAALTLFALAFLARFAPTRWTAPRRVAAAAVLLAAAALGYSSAVVLVGLFGAALIVRAGAGRAGPSPRGARGGWRWPSSAGGLLALDPLLRALRARACSRGAVGVEAEPDLFPGGTFAIFHNESRQALPRLAAGLLDPRAGRRWWPPRLRCGAPGPRPGPCSWPGSLAWALVMVLKEPAALPPAPALGQGGPVPLPAARPARGGRGVGPAPRRVAWVGRRGRALATALALAAARLLAPRRTRLRL